MVRVELTSMVDMSLVSMHASWAHEFSAKTICTVQRFPEQTMTKIWSCPSSWQNIWCQNEGGKGWLTRMSAMRSWNWPERATLVLTMCCAHVLSYQMSVSTPKLAKCLQVNHHVAARYLNLWMCLLIWSSTLLIGSFPTWMSKRPALVQRGWGKTAFITHPLIQYCFKHSWTRATVDEQTFKQTKASEKKFIEACNWGNKQHNSCIISSQTQRLRRRNQYNLDKRLDAIDLNQWRQLTLRILNEMGI